MSMVMPVLESSLRGVEPSPTPSRQCHSSPMIQPTLRELRRKFLEAIIENPKPRFGNTEDGADSLEIFGRLTLHVQEQACR